MDIKKIEIEDLSPKESDPNIKKLLPTVLKPYRGSFIISGVNVAVANAIRRTILSDVPVKYMKFDSEQIKTNDEYILNDFVLSRIRLIPIKQSIPDNAVFSINVHNTTDDIITVHSSDIKKKFASTFGKADQREQYFNETFPVIQLNAGKKLTIEKIYIERDYATKYGTSLACNAVCIPVDIKPESVSSSISDPHSFKIGFISNGNETLKNIIQLACDEIISSIKKVIAEVDNDMITTADDISVLNVKPSSDTVGNLFMKTISEDFPNISAVTYYINDTNKELTLRIKTKIGDAGKIINTTALQLIKLFMEIKKKIK